MFTNVMKQLRFGFKTLFCSCAILQPQPAIGEPLSVADYQFLLMELALTVPNGGEAPASRFEILDLTSEYSTQNGKLWFHLGRTRKCRN